MEIRWGKTRSTNFIPDNVREDAAETIVRERHYASAIDQIIAEHAQQGGFDNLEGKGKPLNLEGKVHENYYLSRVMKNANVLPHWLELQHEIRDMLKSLIDAVDRNATPNLEAKIAEINIKIKKYNRVCPNPLFEKPHVTVKNYRTQAKQFE
ncbi:DUF1992 domain-containing protein [Ferroacidibacillus organovorans]|uniref:DnaJ homologue subfamily C member 28 conserved domain-containing protein n=1 Tax=Ferroacidibacillus organovorans TaxID=1765683 RepID=A0A162T8D0_9BACL|nr:DUF1992 domain-containing protein [Ferroacidibacillus organovorans]KYP80564.1 hypothetical protein AYJ22_10885 [Ferroacidibacillus organovorans]OAG93467.1 hypothetical protein AYW79_10585 [Ferroacidibacillus organovorans]OPG17065.1 hypothetical protein B2M26_03440 [Ferroacidibacillus organovorans]